MCTTTLTTGATTSTLGHITRLTASAVHGTGADITTLGTAVHGTGIHGHIHHTDITDGTTRSIWEDGMTLGTTAMADGTGDGITHIMVTCIRITADGMEVGIHTGATTRTTTTLSISRTTTGMDQDTAQDPTGSSRAAFQREEASLRQAGQEGLQRFRQHQELRPVETRQLPEYRQELRHQEFQQPLRQESAAPQTQEP